MIHIYIPCIRNPFLFYLNDFQKTEKTRFLPQFFTAHEEVNRQRPNKLRKLVSADFLSVRRKTYFQNTKVSPKDKSAPTVSIQHTHKVLKAFIALINAISGRKQQQLAFQPTCVFSREHFPGPERKARLLANVKPELDDYQKKRRKSREL